MEKTLILGLGNVILTDDGVGIRVASLLREAELPRGVDVAEASVGGLRLLETIAGYARLVLVDAMLSAGGRPGEVYVLRPGDLQTTRHAGSAHDLTFASALALGRRLGMNIADDRDITIVAVEVEDLQTLGEGLTPNVEAAIPLAVETVLKVLGDKPF